jgi:hypothetical protein
MPLGLRGAVEIRGLLISFRQGTKAEISEADAVINQAAVVTKIDRPGLMNAFEQIADDAATKFLYDTV